MEQLGKRTLCVNLRIYPLVGVNQRSMRVWHAAKSTPNATSAIRALGVDSAFGIWPNQRSMRVWHAAKSTPNALFGIWPNQRQMRFLAFGGFSTPIFFCRSDLPVASWSSLLQNVRGDKSWRIPRVFAQVRLALIWQ